MFVRKFKITESNKSLEITNSLQKKFFRSTLTLFECQNLNFHNRHHNIEDANSESREMLRIFENPPLWTFYLTLKVWQSPRGKWGVLEE